MTTASGLASALTSRLQALWGTAVEVTALRPLPGGASRESWDVQVRTAGDAQASDTEASDTEASDTEASDAQASDAQAGDAQASDAQASETKRRLILLRDAGGRARPDRNVAVEAAAMIAARAAGVPAPELYDYGEGALGQAYLLMQRLDGETIPRRLLRDDAYAAVRRARVPPRVGPGPDPPGRSRFGPGPAPGRRARPGDRAVRVLRRAQARARDRPALAGRAPARSRRGRAGPR